VVRRTGFRRDRCNHDVGPERFQIARLFNRRFVGHDEDALVAFDRGGNRETNACVAGGCFDDCAAGLQDALALRGGDHRNADPVFDGETGIEILHLCENQRLQSFIKPI